VDCGLHHRGIAGGDQVKMGRLKLLLPVKSRNGHSPAFFEQISGKKRNQGNDHEPGNKLKYVLAFEQPGSHIADDQPLDHV
jgi:hypothetical protein